MIEAIHEPDEARDIAAVDQDEVFQRVVAEFGPALARFSLGYERNQTAREDLCQEILFAIWQSLAVFDNCCSLRTWVYRVAHNTAVKHVMREKRRAFGRLESLDRIEEPRQAHDLEDEMHRESAVQYLSRLILKLKPLDRQVILLYLEDMRAKEIAEITGLSHGSIGIRIHRIKHLLKKIDSSGVEDV